MRVSGEFSFSVSAFGVGGMMGDFQKVKFFISKGGTGTPPGLPSSQLFTYACNKYHLKGRCFGFNIVPALIST